MQKLVSLLFALSLFTMPLMSFAQDDDELAQLQSLFEELSRLPRPVDKQVLGLGALNLGMAFFLPGGGAAVALMTLTQGYAAYRTYQSCVKEMFSRQCASDLFGFSLGLAGWVHLGAQLGWFKQLGNQGAVALGGAGAGVRLGGGDAGAGNGNGGGAPALDPRAERNARAAAAADRAEQRREEQASKGGSVVLVQPLVAPRTGMHQAARERTQQQLEQLQREEAAALARQKTVEQEWQGVVERTRDATLALYQEQLTDEQIMSVLGSRDVRFIEPAKWLVVDAGEARSRIINRLRNWQQDLSPGNVVLPLNLSRSHWVVLVIDWGKGTLTFFDPAGRPLEGEEQEISSLLSEMLGLTVVDMSKNLSLRVGLRYEGGTIGHTTCGDMILAFVDFLQSGKSEAAKSLAALLTLNLIPSGVTIKRAQVQLQRTLFLQRWRLGLFADSESRQRLEAEGIQVEGEVGKLFDAHIAPYLGN